MTFLKRSNANSEELNEDAVGTSKSNKAATKTRIQKFYQELWPLVQQLKKVTDQRYVLERKDVTIRQIDGIYLKNQVYQKKYHPPGYVPDFMGETHPDW